jgi:hypothetical protein
MLTEETPGFACFSEALKATRTGETDQETVVWYQDALGPRLAQTRQRLGKLVVPSTVVTRVNPTLKNAEILCDRLQRVLDLVEDYLHDGCGDSLDEAISVLDVLHNKFGQVF